MLAQKPKGGRRQKIVCGRKHCGGECKRFRHVSDFSVIKWADMEKTRPQRFRNMCRTCAERDRKSRYTYKRGPRRDTPSVQPPRRVLKPKSKPKPRVEEHVDPRILEARRASAIIGRMSKEDRHEYNVEGCLPITAGWGLSDEDYDPTPVPKGCPSCYLTGGLPCDTCPDKQRAKERMRAARKQGLISPV
jgi:hypothetical protein